MKNILLIFTIAAMLAVMPSCGNRNDNGGGRNGNDQNNQNNNPHSQDPGHQGGSMQGEGGNTSSDTARHRDSTGTNPR